jgi:hypothetical protein
MPNINVTVEETTYRNARVWAATNNTNVSQMVRQFLDMVAEGEVADLAEGANSANERMKSITYNFKQHYKTPLTPLPFRLKLH